jgi:acyl dehydratase
MNPGARQAQEVTRYLKDIGMEKIRFDDVEALGALVSDEFGAWSTEIEISQDMIDRFADLTGDRQWIHVDVERARRESPFKTTIAHGFLTLSLLGRVRPPDSYQIVGFKNVLNYGSDGLRFLAPVPSGSRIHARARLAGVERKKNGTLVTREVAVHVVGSDKPSLVDKGLVLYQG